MTSAEKEKKLYKKYRTEYFKKYFIAKNIDTAMYESSKDIILDLTSLLVKICMLIECLDILRHDEKFFSKLNYTCKQRFKTILTGMKMIKKILYNILKPICEGLSEEM